MPPSMHWTCSDWRWRRSQVRVLGESYTPDDEEDSALAEVTAVWLYQARYRVPLERAIAGALNANPIRDLIGLEVVFVGFVTSSRTG